MVVWSNIRPLLSNAIIKNIINGGKRNMSGDHNIFPLQPSKFQWNRFKNLFHFYAMLGIIPLGTIVTLTNVFIGPATLSEIPEDYEPKYWEYYRHPISRFIARYIFTNPQEDYEKFLHFIFEESEKMKIRQLEAKIKAKMAERGDYQAYYYIPVDGKYVRRSRDSFEYSESITSRK